MSDWKYLTGPMRLPFIILTPACYLVGLGAALYEAGRVNALHAVLALIGAVCTHLSVNILNEYADFRSGLDATTQRTPFSGGSGTLPARPGLARRTLIMGLTTTAIVALIGVYFLIVWGWALLPLGALGLLVIVAYTPWMTRSPILCLIAPGLGFGTLMVMGTAFVLTGRYSWTAGIGSLVPFFLVSDLLLLNQFPDVEADRGIGRRHLPIVAGRRASSYVYALFLLLAYVSIVVGVVVSYLPAASLLGLITLALAVPAAMGAIRHPDDVGKLIQPMGMNVLVNILTPALVAVGLMIG